MEMGVAILAGAHEIFLLLLVFIASRHHTDDIKTKFRAVPKTEVSCHYLVLIPSTICRDDQ